VSDLLWLNTTAVVGAVSVIVPSKTKSKTCFHNRIDALYSYSTIHDRVPLNWTVRSLGYRITVGQSAHNMLKALRTEYMCSTYSLWDLKVHESTTQDDTTQYD
jgi:hypothetical protein